MTHHVTVRLPEGLLARLDALAAARGGNRSQTLRAVLVEAAMPAERRGVPDEVELRELLGEAARSGSVQACRALFDEYRREKASEPPPPSIIDELAARGAARRAAANGRVSHTYSNGGGDA